MTNRPSPELRAAVLTVSDRCFQGEQDDRSGTRIAERLAGMPRVIIERCVVPDERDRIAAAVVALSCDRDLLISTGGTGLAPRDVTPEAVTPLLDRTIPGMGEIMRLAGARTTPRAMLSRQLGGARGRCLVLVLPGSVTAVDECLDSVWDVLPHALELVSGHRLTHAERDG